VAQDPGEIRPSLALAGLGSLYLAADALGLANVEPRDSSLPQALRPVDRPAPSPVRSGGGVDIQLLGKAQGRGAQWLQTKYTPDPPNIPGFNYIHYYLYSLERYQTFREAAVGRAVGKTAWYDDGARYLIRTPASDGSWESQCGAVPDTAFGVLFLVRSTQKSYQKVKSFGSGTLVGGRGLPPDAEVDLKLGQLVPRKLKGPAAEILDIIEDPRNPNFLRAAETLSDLARAEDEQNLSEQAKRLRKLAGSDQPEARAAAVKALSRARNLDDVPLLIEALGDEEPLVYLAAEEGLRFLRRSYSPPELTDTANAQQRAAVAEKWRKWYGTIRPSPRAAE
jgi:hypothetical protein